MRFRAEHLFDAPPVEVAALLVDPSFYAGLELPDVGPAEVIARTGRTAGSVPDARSRDDGLAAGTIVLRYEYTGGLDALARRLLGGTHLAWTQELALRRDPGEEGSFTGVLEIHADANPRMLHGRADVRLARASGGGTRRLVDGELVVALPGLGAMAERRIVPGILQRLDVEAATLGRRLS